MKEAALKAAWAFYSHGARGCFSTLVQLSFSCYSLLLGEEEVSQKCVEEKKGTHWGVWLLATLCAHFV